MEVINPRIVIRRRKDSFWHRIMKTPIFAVTLEAGVERETETMRFGHTQIFDTVYCNTEQEVQIAANEMSKKITGDHKMMVVDTTHEFQNVEISDTNAYVWEDSSEKLF